MASEFLISVICWSTSALLFFRGPLPPPVRSGAARVLTVACLVSAGGFGAVGAGGLGAGSALLDAGGSALPRADAALPRAGAALSRADAALPRADVPDPAFAGAMVRHRCVVGVCGRVRILVVFGMGRDNTHLDNSQPYVTQMSI